MSRILLIEDEDSLARGLVDVLRVKGYVVERAAEGNEGLTRALGEGYDLILLDIELPGLSGLEILRELRTQGNTSRVLMLTSRASEMDKVLGFELGVDDYLSKPFSLSELLGRIGALLRRSLEPAEIRSGSLEIRFGKAVVDLEAFRTTRDRQEIKLPTKAYAVLKHLWENRGQVVSRDELIDSVWGEEEYITQRTLNNLVVRIRQVIEKVPEEPSFLKTVHGVGYRLDL
ncbi:MAG: response regulator transcription factor [Vulcanimicrobiota bacterium]